MGVEREEMMQPNMMTLMGPVNVIIIEEREWEKRRKEGEKERREGERREGKGGREKERERETNL